MESAGLPPPARPGPAATQQEMVEADLLALGELAEAKAGQVVAVLSLGDVLLLWRWRPRAVDIWGVTDRQTIQAAGSLLTMDTVPTAARVGEARLRQMAELATEPASSPAVTLGDGNVDDQEEAEEPGAEDGSGGELWTMVRLNRTAEFVGSDDKVLLTALGWKRPVVGPTTE